MINWKKVHDKVKLIGGILITLLFMSIIYIVISECSLLSIKLFLIDIILICMFAVFDKTIKEIIKESE